MHVSRPHRVARRRDDRQLASPRRPLPARRGSGTPVRGGSRGSRRTRRPARSAFASSHSAWRSWRSARTDFGIDSYAASRMSRCRKRYASSPANTGRSGRISSLRTSAPSSRRDERSALRAREHLDRSSMEDLALDRGALERSTLTVAQLIETCGEKRVDRRRDGNRGQVSHDRPAPVLASRAGPSSISIESISSTNNGLPSAASAIRDSSRSGALVLRRRDSRPAACTRCPRAARAGRSWRSACRRPSRDEPRAARAAPCRGAGSALRATIPRGARRDRERSTRPSGCRRTRRTSARRRPSAFEEPAHRVEALLGTGTRPRPCPRSP